MKYGKTQPVLLHMAEKLARIAEIDVKQKKLIKEAAKLIKKPYKRPKTWFARLNKAIAILSVARSLDIQKQMILAASGPKPNFKPGGITEHRGPAIVGEGGKEIIVAKDGTFVQGPIFAKIDEALINKLNSL